MIKDPTYRIEVSFGQGVSGYIQIEETIAFVSKKDATVFKSKVLAYGWLLKAKLTYPSYKFNLVSL